MVKKFRKVIFWLHLITGLTAGIFIFIMCVSGALLSFQPNILEFAESEMRYVQTPPDINRLEIGEIIEKASVAKPDAKSSNLTLQNDPKAAAVVSFGREGQVFVNPYTGEITGDGANNWRTLFRMVEDAHRWLALSGDARTIGKSLNDAANLLFLFLAISGVYIWFPKKLAWRNFKPVIWFRRGLRGKARNFNWHNVIGFWTSLVLIVLTATAIVISYQWAGNLVYTLTGNEPPKQQQKQQAQEKESPRNLPENLEDLFLKAENQTSWKSISLRLPIAEEANFTIEEGIYWNKFARSSLTVNTETNEISKWETYGEQNAGRQLRSWIRFTHTGETGGIIGQFIGFLACIGGAFLVWTGFSLALRRFQKWRKKKVV
jgi:uncharacterized iron-regulated membrane protein